ncbi:hypothetical protein EPI10_005803 [Gossypium australe]|uniref:Uncharacterized protein n=1 Tax=Gossypium australe TaxID=47621 RepID=A0A5B6WQG0_9ROSI|nr:hypothetical protein EPI10_005803 [Gossypium australe]
MSLPITTITNRALKCQCTKLCIDRSGELRCIGLRTDLIRKIEDKVRVIRDSFKAASNHKNHMPT